MDELIRKSRLFADISAEELKGCLACCGATTTKYKQGETLFVQGESADRLYVLLQGTVSICQILPDGRRTLVNTFQQPGDLFGEVYAFLDRDEYDYYAVAETDVTALSLPRNFLYQRCATNCDHHNKLTQNMLTILAQKAYTLNQKLQIVSLPTLRQKIAMLLLRNLDRGGQFTLTMNREEMADYLGVARPSLSRELLSMQADGLVTLTGKRIAVPDEQRLRDLI